MKALLRKELAPFLPQTLVGALLFAVVYGLAFDVDSALLDPSTGPLYIVLIGALCMGALLGYGQLSAERHGDTLSYLLHRPQPPSRVLAAKAIAGWTLLAVVVHLPPVLFALWERWTSPLGPVVQWARLGEMQVIALACLPAHALGLLCGTLRCAPGLRTALLLLFVGGLGLIVAAFLQSPFVGPAASQGIYAGSLALLALLLLLCLRSELVRMDDAERAPPLSRLLSMGMLSLILIGHPAGGCITGLQNWAASEYSAREPSIHWRKDTGFVYATWSGDMLVEAMDVDGRPVDLVGLISPDGRGSINSMDLASFGFTTAWSEMSFPMPNPVDEARLRIRAGCAIAPGWWVLHSIAFTRPGSGWVCGGAKVFFDADAGRALVLYAPSWPGAGQSEGRSSTSHFVDVPVPSLRPLVRGDGQPFSGPRLFSDFASGSEFRLADADGTLWSLDLSDPLAEFHRVEGVYVQPPSFESPEEPPIRTTREFDWLAYTVRVTDRVTGEVLLEHRQGPLAKGRTTPSAIVLLMSDLLHAPLFVVWGHFTAQSPIRDELDRTDLYAGVFTSRGRRPLLVLAVVVFGCALAWHAQHRLARRGARRFRRAGWAVIVALFGLQGWLLFLALEPRAPRAAPARAEPRRPLLASRAVVLG